ncbi:GNAT family N-acetyltransferase [Xylanimonas ulmi]|uniref:GNAT family N-acetyltransferase n=1 Tax=Xylanimonas ulmi TaxID=228973 RepID=UPI001F5F2E34|nr:GNAT family N-acetyltransferase [Xylanibacterium ulmi]
MTAPEPHVVVRPALTQEAADVAWLAAMTFPLACPPDAAAAEVARHVARQLTPAHFRRWSISADHVLLVAQSQDGAHLGYALLTYGLPDGAQDAAVLREATGSAGPYVELSKIYAHPDALGTGAAAALMRGAIDAAAHLGAAHLAEGHGSGDTPLWLGTNAANARAQAFYRKHGFVVVGTRTYDVGGQAHDDVVMLRR